MAEKFGSADETASQVVETGISRTSQQPAKSFSFYVSMFGLALVALMTAWDATSLTIALPVSETIRAIPPFAASMQAFLPSPGTPEAASKSKY